MEDVIKAMEKIESFIGKKSFDTFRNNEMLVDAVLRNLEIIGEASKNIPKEVRTEHPEIPWSNMIGLRNIVIHKYFEVDVEITWNIATKNIPETKPKIKDMLEELKKES